ncbi:MAG: hypothetical protein VZQ29_02430, partial [Succiniclasticum sp.]|nr:hypothetical protein [Succiniclasticum sp.]
TYCEKNCPVVCKLQATGQPIPAEVTTYELRQNDAENNTVFVLHAFVLPLLFYDAAGRSRQSIDRDPRCLSGGFDVSRYQDPAAEQL